MQPDSAQGEDPTHAALMAELDAIGTDTAEDVPEVASSPASREPKGTGVRFQDPDPNDPDVTIHAPKITRWDRANTKLRELEATKAALPEDADVHSVVSLDGQIARARKAKEVAEGDVSRKHEGIDEWRAGAGRKQRNEERRNGNGTPHAYSREEFSRMDPADKTQHAKDMAWKRCERSRLKKKGLSGERLEAELAVKLNQRLAEREARAGEDAAEATMLADPNFGMF